MKRIIKQLLISFTLVLSLSFSSLLFSQKSYTIYDLHEAFPEEFQESFAWASFPVEDDSFLVFGSFYNEGGPYVHTRKIYCLKITETGEILWSNEQGDYGHDYAVHAALFDDENGYVLSGHHSDTAVIPYNPMMAAFNLDGTPAWYKYFNFPEAWCEATDILPSHDGGYIIPILGIIEDSTHAVLMKIDETGNEVFNKPVFYGENITPDFWIVGTPTNNNEYIFAGEISSGSQGSIVIFKTNEMLDTLWTKTNFDPTMIFPRDIIQTTDNNYVILCRVNNYNTSTYDACLMKINDSGEILWQKYFGGDKSDKGRYLIEDESGNLVFCGSTNSYSENMQAWVVKTDANGNELWNEVLGEEFSSGAQYICEYAPSKYIISGYHVIEGVGLTFHATVTFLDKSPTSVNNRIEDNLSIDLLPNPMREKCTINYKLDKDAYVKIDLMNSQGNLIKNVLSNKHRAGKQSIGFLNEGLDAGVYFLKFSINNDISMRKLMIIN